jgi:DNA-binding LacI/PurR family transcriptional regulator
MSNRLPKRPTLKDIAYATGVSVPTVSRILSNARGFTVSQQTKALVLDTAKNIGFHYNTMAKSLRTQKSMCIGLFIPELNNPIYGVVYIGVLQAAQILGYDVFLSTPNFGGNNEKIFFKWSQERRVDGLLLATDIADKDAIQNMENLGYPFVAYFMSSLTPYFVSIDEYQAMDVVGSYLIKLGHRDIAFISGPLSRASFAFRLEGYKRMLAKHGISYQPRLVIEGGRSNWRDGYVSTKKLIDRGQRYTAVVGSTMNISLGILVALQESGIRVPEEISVIGIHDTPHAEISSPNLTVLRTPLEEMGYQAMMALYERMQGKEVSSVIISAKYEMIIRSSCSAPIMI